MKPEFFVVPSAIVLSATIVDALALPRNQLTAGSFTIPIHHKNASHQIRTRRDASGPISLTSAGLWFVNATIGGQLVELCTDTGSGDLITNVSPASDTSPVYNPYSSSTAVDQQSQFTANFVEGTLQGEQWTDVVCLGDGGFCVNGADVDVTTNNPSGFGFSRSGLLGLQIGASFIQEILPSLDQPVMAFQLSLDSSKSILSFGSYDTSGDLGPLATIPIGTSNPEDPGYWVYYTASLASNGQDIGESTIHFDTGSEIPSAPEAVVRVYYANVQGAVDVNGDATAWNVPCDVALPNIDYTFGDVVTSVQVLKLVGDGTTCGSLFINSGSTDGGAIGLGFLITRLIVFNLQNSTISFATHNQ